jgi:hypothetical protein
MVDLFFVTDKGGVNWVEFVRGYLKCCGRMPVSALLNTLLRLFAATGVKAGIPLKLEFEAIDDGDYKFSGSLLPIDVLMFLGMCWTMLWNSRTWRVLKERESIYIFRILVLWCYQQLFLVLRVAVDWNCGIVIFQV